MNDNFFDKYEEEKPVFVSLTPPQLIKEPLILNIKPIIATVLEYIVKNHARDTKVTFEQIIDGVKFLEGNQNLTTMKLKTILDDIRKHLQTLGIVNGIVILANCIILKADLHLSEQEQKDEDLLDFIYRDLVQDKY